MNHLTILENKILSLEKLSPFLSIWRFREHKVVFTNGCFDLLHLGHIDYLAKAASMGNKLIIGLNSDSSTAALKGPKRPITDQKSRSHILAALSFVDAVVLFDEATPYELIKAIRPNILVKGADYTVDKIVGSD
ncbi:MAG: adenylyltransferase/cytidyltransferase family protein, partial [Pyrinomonadaceae bacterium]|nr:adenylyltransferase/cytidyltransferase family protein [Sphingobacteriaceae bacterium]